MKNGNKYNTMYFKYLQSTLDVICYYKYKQEPIMTLTRVGALAVKGMAKFTQVNLGELSHDVGHVTMAG